MAQWSKFIGAPSRNEFWEPQEESNDSRRANKKEAEMGLLLLVCDNYIVKKSVLFSISNSIVSMFRV